MKNKIIIVGSDISCLILAYYLTLPVYLVNYIQAEACDEFHMPFCVGDFSLQTKNISQIETNLMIELGFCGLLKSGYNSVKLLNNKIILSSDNSGTSVQFEQCILVNLNQDLPHFEIYAKNKKDIIIIDYFSNFISIIETIKTNKFEYKFLYSKNRNNSKIKDLCIVKQNISSFAFKDKENFDNLKEDIFENKKLKCLTLSKIIHERKIIFLNTYLYKDVDNYKFLYINPNDLLRIL